MRIRHKSVAVALEYIVERTVSDVPASCATQLASELFSPAARRPWGLRANVTRLVLVAEWKLFEGLHVRCGFLVT